MQKHQTEILIKMYWGKNYRILEHMEKLGKQE